ncbi:MAG: heterocyst frequency control protein PatD [Synechococcales cyanobacterium C42_A2020_086]|jgi:hypothetical protein|nr:heterocyst frequency control protein PatD [Synechococcales cyanobacterium M58_A2018_015]MBF2073723.1 heterocyst frequency control protein PatD [Synechococcales cyanobacterium C42_A2020_086]
MESTDYQQSYRRLQQILCNLQTALDTANHDLIQDQLREVQQTFQAILNLDLASLPTSQAVRLQSYQTEINKQLRLLNTDLLFWQSARQSATQQQRQAQAQHRLTLLLRYCEAILGEELLSAPSSAEKDTPPAS